MPTFLSSPLIAARVDPITKRCFGNLAAARGLTESALLTLMVRAVLADNDTATTTSCCDDAMAPSDRISVRLRSGDLDRLRQRANARGMRPARYLTALIHAHVRAEAPLPVAELAALKQAVSELTAWRRQLNGLTSVPDAIAPTPASLTDLAPAIESLRLCVSDLVRANLISWETSDV